MTHAIVFPFDCFGGAGTGAGAQLLGDALREIIDDNETETAPTRADCYKGMIEVFEMSFETQEQILEWRTVGRKIAQQSLKESDFMLWLAGNHLGVLPLLEELGPETLVVQLDAHIDIYALHDTTRELSHGNYLSHARRPLPQMIHLGHRDLFLLPETVKDYFESVQSAERIALNPLLVAEWLRSRIATASRVWIDIDCDVFDPAFFPAVQSPLSFGLSPLEVLRLIDLCWTNHLLGVSISEFDPGRDVRDTSLNLLGWLIEWLLLKRYEGKKSNEASVSSVPQREMN